MPRIGSHHAVSVLMLCSVLCPRQFCRVNKDMVVTVPTLGPVTKDQVHLQGVGSLGWCKDFYKPVPKQAISFDAAADCWESLLTVTEVVAWSRLYETQEAFEAALVRVFSCLKQGPRPDVPVTSMLESIVGVEAADFLLSLVSSEQHVIIQAIPDLVVTEEPPVLSDLGTELAARYGPRLVLGAAEVGVKVLQSDVFELVSAVREAMHRLPALRSSKVYQKCLLSFTLISQCQ